MGRTGTGRSLQTARAVLRVLRLLGVEAQGARTEDVAQLLGKSPATASYLLNSLCQEGFAFRDAATGRYRLAERRGERPSPLREGALRDAVAELHARTGQRAYAATLTDSAIVVHEAKGRQGVPRLPGLGTVIRGEAHALALGKCLLAQRSAGAGREYAVRFGLRRFTPSTITDPAVLEAELVEARQAGYAVDREEYAEGFCCLAAPLHVVPGVHATLAISVPVRRFAADGRALAEALVDVAASARP